MIVYLNIDTGRQERGRLCADSDGTTLAILALTFDHSTQEPRFLKFKLILPSIFRYETMSNCMPPIKLCDATMQVIVDPHCRCRMVFRRSKKRQKKLPRPLENGFFYSRVNRHLVQLGAYLESRIVYDECVREPQNYFANLVFRCFDTAQFQQIRWLKFVELKDTDKHNRHCF